MTKEVPLKGKLAFVLFVMGKMTSLPAVYLIFSDRREDAGIVLCIYATLISLSIALAFMSCREKKKDLINIEKYISKEGTFMFKIVNGKVIEIVNQ